MRSCSDVYDFAANAKLKVSIQNQSSANDSYGGQTTTWVEVLKAWAVMTPIRGNELFRSDQLQSRVTHKIIIRYKSDFANTRDFGAYRIVYDSRIFNIKYVHNLDDVLKNEGKVYQQLVCEENDAEVANG